MKFTTNESLLRLVFMFSSLLLLNFHAMATLQNDVYDRPNLITCKGRIKAVMSVPIKGYDFVSIRLDCNGEEKIIWLASKSYLGSEIFKTDEVVAYRDFDILGAGSELDISHSHQGYVDF